jgi:hypothetical protein
MANGSNGSNLPLAINILGPSVLQKNGDVLEVWLPDVGSKYKHEVGIGTTVDSKKLDPGNYALKDPNPTAFKGNWPDPYCPKIQGKDSEIYLLVPNGKPSGKYIHFTLPRPRQIICLAPVSCKIIYNNTPEKDFKYRATGVRVLYEATGVPVLTGSDLQGNPLNWPLPIDVAPEDKQVEVTIDYHPFIHDDKPDHPEAKSDWGKIGEMIGIKGLDVEFDKSAPVIGKRIFVGPAHDCITPIAMI